VSFHKAFVTVTYLTVISAILSLSLAEGSPLYITIGLIGTLASWYFVDTRSRFHLSRGGATALSVIAFIYLILEIFYISGFFVLSFTHFLIIIQIIKLCLEKEEKDYIQIYLISFMHLIVTSVLTTNIIFAFLFVTYILVTTWTLILFHLKTEGASWHLLQTSRKINNTQKVITRRTANGKNPAIQLHEANFINRYFFLSTSIITIVILLLTTIIFLMIPRYTAGLFISKLGKISKLSGFSNKVNLNSIGSIKLDFTPVMRMELPDYDGKQDKEFYIRGISFDHYSNGWWTVKRKRNLDFYANSVGDIYPLLRGNILRLQSITQKFTVEELDTRVLFHLYPVKNIKSKFKRVTLTATETILLPYPYFRGAQYEVTSGLMPEYRALPNVTKNYPQFVAECFLNKNNISKKIRNLALRITAQDDHEKEDASQNSKRRKNNPFTQAKAIEKYLKENYSYTLDNPSGGSIDPIEDFLFRSRAGHCEYFATAMALLLRSINIPTRYINGFKANEWNEIGGYYVIRQKDAHSWVEAYFYPIGWYPFDPTPPGYEEPSGLYKYTVNTKLGKYLDFIQMKWRSWVINYTFDAQRKAFNKYKNKTRNFRESLIKTITIWRQKAKNLALSKYISLKTVLWSISGIIFFSVLIHIGYQYLKKTRFFKELLKRQIRISVRFYAELIRILKRRGITRNPYHTPFEFLEENIDKNSSEYHGIRIITELFYKVRYGGKKLTSNEVNTITDIIYKLKYDKRNEPEG